MPSPCNSSPTTRRCSWGPTWISPGTWQNPLRWNRLIGLGFARFLCLSREMAVNLKRPLPREPLSGKRHRRRVLALGALLAFGGFAFLAPAEAQEGSLSAGASAFTAGKYDATVRMMTGVLPADTGDP